MKNSTEYLRNARVLSVNGVKNFNLENYMEKTTKDSQLAKERGKRPAYQGTQLEAKK